MFNYCIVEMNTVCALTQFYDILRLGPYFIAALNWTYLHICRAKNINTFHKNMETSPKNEHRDESTT